MTTKTANLRPSDNNHQREDKDGNLLKNRNDKLKLNAGDITRLTMELPTQIPMVSSIRFLAAITTEVACSAALA